MKALLTYEVLILVLLLQGCGNIGREQKKKHFLHKGNLAYKEKLYQQAVRYYREAIQLDSSFAQAYNNLGIVLHHTGVLGEARSAFSKCIELDPEFVDAYFNRSNTYYELRNFKLALADLNTIADIYQPSEDVLFAKGLAFSGLKKYDSARVMFEKTLAADSSNIENHVNLATTLYYLKNFDRSKKLCKAALLMDARYTEAYNVMGLIMMENQQLDSAEYFFTKGLETESNNAYILNNRGFVFLQQSKYSNALEDINESIVIDPDNAWAYRNKGIYYLKNGDTKNAERLLRQAVSMDNELKLGHYYLGQLYRATEDDSSACREFLISAGQGEEEGSKAYQQFCR